MTDERTPLTPEDWLEHLDWTRSLARGLVSDPHAADDVAQEAMLTAMRHPPRDGRSPRGWLRAVVRTAAWREWRRDRARALREVRAARKDSGPTAEELHERLATQRTVMDAVEALDEPYRTVILLRYFEGMPPRKIAAREGVPVETVKTRLRRALAHLRRSLERSCGGRKAWIIALLPLALAPRASLASTGGALLMGTQSKITIPALAVILVTLFIGRSVFFPTDRGRNAGAGPEVAGQPAPVDAGDPPEETGSDLAAAPHASAGPTGAEDSTGQNFAVEDLAPLVEIQGRVLHADGSPAAGVAIGWVRSASEEQGTDDRSPVLATSDVDGWFVLPTRAPRGVLEAVGDDLVTVMRGVCSGADAEIEPRVVVAPALDLTGLVVDASLDPVAEALVAVELPDGFRGRFDEVLDAASDEEWRFTTDATGTFDLGRVPVIEGARFEVVASGYRFHTEAVSDLAPGFRRVMLDAVEPEKAVRGIVVDRRGTPVAGARVALGLDTVRSAGDGTFSVPLDDPRSLNTMASQRFGLPEAHTITALLPGRLPGTLQVPLDDAGAPRWPDPLVLTIGDAALEIAGRVVDAAGEPRAGIEVWISDPTAFGSLEPGRPRLASVENLVAGVAGRGRLLATTDEEGRFLLTGLLDRSYTLEAMDPATLLRTSIESAAGSTGVELRFAADALHPTLAGVLVDGSGRPVAGATIRAMCDTLRQRYEGMVVGTMHATAEATTTDEVGAFTLASVPRDLAYLRIDGDDIIPLEWGRREQGLADLVGDDPEALTITVARRCHVQIELLDPSRADAVEFLDARGETVTANVMHGDGRRTVDRVEIVDGRTPVLSVADRAATVRILLGDVEVERRPVAWESGAVHVFEF